MIADFEATEKMLALRQEAHGKRPLVRPRLVIGVPPEITAVERRAVKDSGYRVKASEVHLVDEPMAAAIGSGLPVTEAAGNMVIDIGGGTTDIAVISGRHCLRAFAPGRGQQAGRGDHPAHEAGPSAAGRRTDGRAHQVRDRIGGAARRSAEHGSEGAAHHRRRAAHHHD